ncbi:MAG: hypothetical protein IKM04_00885 [Clostridia bacterium]|nr:hypothetical protein [Clostridia bacterium]
MTVEKFLSGDLSKYKSFPFWSWNDTLEPESLRAQIREMKAAGIGGFFMHARGGLTTEYMGKEWFDAIRACIDEAEKCGMEAWCYDENGWPSGFAGMKLLDDPSNLAHFLVWQEHDGFDPEALAVYRKNGERLERVYSGEDRLYCLYDRTNSSVVDICNPEVVDRFIELTHEEYFKECGESFGKAMKGFFTDEPQYFRWDTAYTPCIIPLYRETYGEDLLDRLGALFIDCEGAYELRFRYWRLMNILYTENFAGRIYRWCQEHNCMLTGHSIEESGLNGQMMCCAGIMPFYEYEHIPGIDWLGRGISSELSPKQVSSAAAQLGKKQVMTETFACTGWDVTPRELKRIAQWQFVNGVNRICQHLYPYSVRGQRKRDHPTFFSSCNPWTEKVFKDFNDYFTNIGAMLAESDEFAEVGIIHPITSSYLVYNRNNERASGEIEGRFIRLIERFGRENICHHYIDERLLEKYGSVENGLLGMGLRKYKYVVVPEMLNITSSTAEILKKYVASGGRIWLEGKAPEYIDGAPADTSFLVSNVEFDDMRQKEYSIQYSGSELRSTYRSGEFGRFIYIVNLSDRKAETCTLRVKAESAALLDVLSGETKPLSAVKDGEDLLVSLSFKPCDSALIVLDSDIAVLPEQMKIVLADENSLTLDLVELSYDGESWEGPYNVMAVSDRLLRERKNGKRWLRYTFDVAALPETVSVEIENTGSPKVSVNGKALSEFTSGTIEPRFIRADVAKMLRLGRNEIVLAIDYFQAEHVYSVLFDCADGTESLINCLSYDTDIEAVYLRGSFSVNAQYRPDGDVCLISDGGFTVDLPKTELDPRNITQNGYPFFAGSITFECELEADKPSLRLPLKGRHAAVTVSVNGGSEQTVFFDDEVILSNLNIGKNTLRITVISSNRNLLGPHHWAHEADPHGVGPYTFSLFGSWREDGTSDSYAPRYAFVRLGI